jgi:Tir chaperone protein (CesT) family
VVDFELDESGGQLFLYASLGARPAAGSSGLYEQLLAGNLFWKDTGGATPGLDREGDRVVLLQSLPAERVSEADLKVAVERFVDVAEAWTRRVSEVVAPPQDVAGERQASGLLTPDQFV